MLSYTKSGYTEAENLLKKSLEIAEHIIQEKGDTDDNILILATSLDYLGYILSNSLNNDIIRITLADTYLKEAVMLRQILCSAHPEHYRLMHDYAWSLDNLGAFYTKIDVRNINFDTKQESNGIIHLTEEEIVQNKRHTEALLKEALEIAEEKKLDLVLVSPNVKPPVCKIMNYGKYKFEQAKKEKEAKKKQKIAEIKEIRITPNIEEHDFGFKAKNARKFLEDGNKVKITVRFKGREVNNSKLGEDVLNKFIENLEDIASVDKKPKLEGKNMFIMLSKKA